MSAFIKKYPRARVSRHATLDGWVIDIILRHGARPNRVAATYASIAWAHKAAGLKLGARPAAPAKHTGGYSEGGFIPSDQRVSMTADSGFVLSKKLVGLTPFKKPGPVAADAGRCDTCNRPMRPVGTKATDQPGTTLRQRAGLCQSCHARNIRERA